MIIGESTPLSTPTIQIPQWNPFFNDPISPFANCRNTGHQFLDSSTPLLRYLPSNEPPDSLTDDPDFPVDAFSCDHFRMYEFKVRRCARARSHDWTDCPYAHPGEKARRRDPRKYNYSGISCPEFRNGGCRKGDACEFSHGVFECWLHPARYRTQPCKDGPACRRRVCFFAHAPDELRVLPQLSPREIGYGSGSAMSNRFETYASSPTSVLFPPSESPPISPPVLCRSFNSVTDIAAAMSGLKLGKTKSGWGMQNGSVFGLPNGSLLRPGFFSPPLTPTRNSGRVIGQSELWENDFEEEPAMERVESGRDLRAKIYEKLSKENSMDPVGETGSE